MRTNPRSQGVSGPSQCVVCQCDSVVKIIMKSIGLKILIMMNFGVKRVGCDVALFSYFCGSSSSENNINHHISNKLTSVTSIWMKIKFMECLDMHHKSYE